MVTLLLVVTSKVKLFSSDNRRLLYRTKEFLAHNFLRQEKPEIPSDTFILSIPVV